MLASLISGLLMFCDLLTVTRVRSIREIPYDITLHYYLEMCKNKHCFQLLVKRIFIIQTN